MSKATARIWVFGFLDFPEHHAEAKETSENGKINMVTDVNGGARELSALTEAAQRQRSEPPRPQERACSSPERRRTHHEVYGFMNVTAF